MAADFRILSLCCALLTGCAATPDAGPPPVSVSPSTSPSVDDRPRFAAAPSTLVASARAVTGIVEPPPVDLWDLVRTDFRLPAQQDNPRIRAQRDWYVKHPRYLKRVAERARRYAWYIHGELAARGMPAEIALLPIVESAYDPFAYSHGRAAGLWQFIPSTGKHFGLRQDWWYDGRRDIPESTRAALDYLENLHDQFDGDWLLALAAYNSGAGTVRSAQRYNRRKGRATGFWELRLPRETRAYVPKLVALAELVARPDAFGIELEPLPATPAFHIVETGGQIDLAVAAGLAGIDLETLYELNPGFNQWATSPDGPHRLLIPAAATATFRQAIAKLPAEKRIQWNRVEVRQGETLSHLAKRYRTTVEVLQTANRLRGATIRAGSHLMVPVASQGSGAYTLSAAQRLSRTQNRNRSGKGYKTRHVVRRGDTLWDLSREYDVGVRSLASWNGMAPGDPLRIGQTLVVWNAKPVSHGNAKVRPVHYTVRKGDSLSRIASRFAVTVNDLRRWNALERGKYLQPGQHIKLYVDVTRQTGV